MQNPLLPSSELNFVSKNMFTPVGGATHSEKQGSRETANAERSLKRMIWAYLLVLLFEGSARKWLLPSLSAPLLLIRDPLLLYMYWVAIRHRLLPFNGWLFSWFIIAVLSFCAGLFALPNLPVVLFGFHANFFHLPLIFLIGRICDRNMVLSVGGWILLLSIPMAVLVATQFRSSPEAWVNSAASEQGFLLSGGSGKVRPAGTFSYHTGTGEFFCLVAAFFLTGVLEKRTYPTWLTFLSGGALVVALTTMISRSALISVGLIFCVAIVIAVKKVQYWPRLATLGFVFVILLAILFPLGILQEGAEALNTRISEAAVAEGGAEGFLQRFAEGFTSPGESIMEIPYLGFGLGRGTTAGSMLRKGRFDFLLGEGEWMRVIHESGPVLGVYFILWRVALLFFLLAASWQALRNGNILPLLLFAACWHLLLIGQFGQTTTLGFTVLTAGMCLGAMRLTESRAPGISA
jgi:hypothetical protein